MEKKIFYDELKKFLIKKVPDYNKEIKGTTNLIYEGLLDSFSVVELVIYIERISGKKLEVDKINSKSIETLDNIYNYFLQNSI